MATRRPRPSFEGQLPTQHERPVLPAAVSGLLHLVVIMAVLLLVRNERIEDTSTLRRADTTQQVTMVYVPPPPQPQPVVPPPEPEPAPQPTPPVPQPVLPTPKEQNPVPEPEPNAPPDAQRVEAPEGPPQVTPGKESTGDPDASERATPRTEDPVALAVSMETEAQRIFGRRRGDAAGDAGPVATRPFENARKPTDKCPPIPRDSLGNLPEGTVKGRVVDFESGRPLRNAHLQMVGQPFNTFADNDGNFVLKFDLALMENCRVQLVRISSPGHRDQTLPIVIGGGVSTVPLRRR